MPNYENGVRAYSRIFQQMLGNVMFVPSSQARHYCADVLIGRITGLARPSVRPSVRPSSTGS